MPQSISMDMYDAMTDKILSASFLPSSMSDDVAKKTLIDEP